LGKKPKTRVTGSLAQRKDPYSDVSICRPFPNRWIRSQALRAANATTLGSSPKRTVFFVSCTVLGS
jgi:hypothetical protein